MLLWQIRHTALDASIAAAATCTHMALQHHETSQPAFNLQLHVTSVHRRCGRPDALLQMEAFAQQPPAAGSVMDRR